MAGVAQQAPYLLVGPGQSGKTTAVAECVKHLACSGTARVLVAVHRCRPTVCVLTVSEAAAIAFLKKHLIPFAAKEPSCVPLLACAARQGACLPSDIEVLHA